MLAVVPNGTVVAKDVTTNAKVLEQIVAASPGASPPISVLAEVIQGLDEFFDHRLSSLGSLLDYQQNDSLR